MSLSIVGLLLFVTSSLLLAQGAPMTGESPNKNLVPAKPATSAVIKKEWDSPLPMSWEYIRNDNDKNSNNTNRVSPPRHVVDKSETSSHRAAKRRAVEHVSKASKSPLSSEKDHRTPSQSSSKVWSKVESRTGGKALSLNPKEKSDRTLLTKSHSSEEHISVHNVPQAHTSLQSAIAMPSHRHDDTWNSLLEEMFSDQSLSAEKKAPLSLASVHAKVPSQAKTHLTTAAERGKEVASTPLHPGEQAGMMLHHLSPSSPSPPNPRVPDQEWLAFVEEVDKEWELRQSGAYNPSASTASEKSPPTDTITTSKAVKQNWRALPRKFRKPPSQSASEGHKKWHATWFPYLNRLNKMSRGGEPYDPYMKLPQDSSFVRPKAPVAFLTEPDKEEYKIEEGMRHSITQKSLHLLSKHLNKPKDDITWEEKHKHGVPIVMIEQEKLKSSRKRAAPTSRSLDTYPSITEEEKGTASHGDRGGESAQNPMELD